MHKSSAPVLAGLLLGSSCLAGQSAHLPPPPGAAPPASQAPSPVAAGIPIGLTAAQTGIIASGIRSSALIGAEVYNDRNENIGRIEDFIIATDGSLAVALIEVGSFLGTGNRLVAIPVQQFHQMTPKPVLPRVDREALQKLPAFTWPKPAPAPG
ncbi:MAG: PRC-barrel domain-containing protein [Pseudomonadota bacterium]